MNGKGDTQRPKRITDAEWDARYAGTFCADYRPDPYAQMVADSQAFTATETARVDALCAPRSKVAADTSDPDHTKRLLQAAESLAMATEEVTWIFNGEPWLFQMSEIVTPRSKVVPLATYDEADGAVR